MDTSKIIKAWKIITQPTTTITMPKDGFMNAMLFTCVLSHSYNDTLHVVLSLNGAAINQVTGCDAEGEMANDTFPVHKGDIITISMTQSPAWNATNSLVAWLTLYAAK